MAQVNSVIETVRGFILEHFLPGEDPDLLTPTTPLMSSGILDSINSLKLILFLETEFNIEIAAHEASEEYLDTLENIGKLIESKL